MATQYKTPGVYIQEPDSFPPSIVGVETAVPCFIGYTALATDTDKRALTLIPKRVESMAEFVQFYGRGYGQKYYLAALDAEEETEDDAADEENKAATSPDLNWGNVSLDGNTSYALMQAGKTVFNTASGLHDIRLHPALPLPGVHPEQRHRYRELVQRTRRVFLRHRPLCEDIGSIRVLRPLRTIVRAGVDIDPDARAEAVMAEALFRLALALAPEPRRTGLDPENPTRAFEGPLLRNGMIAPGELSEKPAVIALDALADILRGIPGVLRVADLHLWVEGKGLCAGSYCVDADDYCSLDAGIESDALPLELAVEGRACVMDRGEVLRRLLRRWEAHRTRRPIRTVAREAFAPPEGRIRALTSFAPLGPQLPRVYGLAIPERPSGPAATQLAGFLDIFESMMADFCARLGGVGALASGVPPTDLSAPEHEKLLDMLLTLYGVAADTIPTPPRLRERPVAAARYRAAIKQCLLDHRMVLVRRGGRGFDPAARRRARRLSGVELRTNLLLGGGPDQRERTCLIEHMMLRPHSHERRQQEAGRYSYAMAVSAGIALREEDRLDPRYRAEIRAMLRAELPAHIGLHVHFVDPGRWRRLYDLRHLWRAALALGERHAADQLAGELRDLLERWSQRERADG